MGRSPCCAKEGLNRGAWTVIEDKILIDYIKIHGEGKWRHLPKRAGLKRCGKSCRLRWLNYLRPDIKRGNITHDEEDLIIRLHKLLGNRWSLIAGRLPGRTDNEIKNYWNTNIGKKIQNGNTKTKSSPTTSDGSPSRARQDNKDVDSDHSNPKAPQKTNGPPCLVRTRATRCTRVIVSKEVQPLKAVPSSSLTAHDDDAEDCMKVRCDRDGKIMEQPLPAFVDSDEGNNNTTNNGLDFMGDFEMDEGFFSDLLNMDISEPSCFEDKVMEEDNSNTSTTSELGGCCHQYLSSSPLSNDTHLNNNNNNSHVSEDSLHESEDFHSMSALMENEFDWL